MYIATVIACAAVTLGIAIVFGPWWMLAFVGVFMLGWAAMLYAAITGVKKVESNTGRTSYPSSERNIRTQANEPQPTKTRFRNSSYR